MKVPVATMAMNNHEKDPVLISTFDTKGDINTNKINANKSNRATPIQSLLSFLFLPFSFRLSIPPPFLIRDIKVEGSSRLVNHNVTDHRTRIDVHRDEHFSLHSQDPLGVLRARPKRRSGDCNHENSEVVTLHGSFSLSQAPYFDKGLAVVYRCFDVKEYINRIIIESLK